MCDDSYREVPDRIGFFEITEMSKSTVKIIRSALKKIIPIAPIETNTPKTVASMTIKIPNTTTMIPAIAPNKSTPAAMATAPSGINKINRNGANSRNRMNFIA